MTDRQKSYGAILVNGASSPRRRRYTIGHELGHFLNEHHVPTMEDGFQCTKEDMGYRGRLAMHQRPPPRKSPGRAGGSAWGGEVDGAMPQGKDGDDHLIASTFHYPSLSRARPAGTSVGSRCNQVTAPASNLGHAATGSEACGYFEHLEVMIPQKAQKSAKNCYLHTYHRCGGALSD